jgi:hypothetical protein
VGSSEIIYVAGVEALMQKERQDETQFTTPKKKKKLVEKLVWVPVISFGKDQFILPCEFLDRVC